MNTLNISKLFRQKLVKDFKELAKTFKKSNNPRKFYSMVKKEAIDSYEREMDKFFVGNGFLTDPELEDNHKKNRNAAWGILKSQCPDDGDKSDFMKFTKSFHYTIASCYSNYKQINKDNLERSEKGLENFDEMLDRKEVTHALVNAKDLYFREMKKMCGNLSESEFNEMDHQIRAKCLKSVSII